MIDLSLDRQHILERTADLWEPLRDQRVFITGGTGFVGTWLLQSLAWANAEFALGAQAVVLSRNWEAFRAKAPHLADDPAISCHQGDVRDFAFPEGRFSYIIDSMTESSGKFGDEEPLLMLDTVIGGTRRTLNFARHCGAKRLLQVSSGAVYGRQSPGVSHLAETCTTAPDTMSHHSAYGESKRVAELLDALYAHQCGINVAIARGFCFVGPHLSLEARYAVGNFLRDGLDGKPIVVQGDGTALRSYLYAADMAIWLWTILLCGETCRPYNVGSEEAISIAALANIVADSFQPRPEVRILGSPTPGKPAERYVPSTRRAGNELGLRQCIDLPEAIRRTVAWHSENLRKDNAR
jgi:dTDP-glucose 4,6-dehydratase